MFTHFKLTFSIKLEAEGHIYRQRKGRNGINMEKQNQPQHQEAKRELIELIIEEKFRHIHNISENPTIETHL